MNCKIVSLSLVACLAAAGTSRAAVTMTQATTPPATGAHGIANLDDSLNLIVFDGVAWNVQNAPGDGVTPGASFGATSFSDNGGPPGQTFTTLSGAPLYRLDAITLKGEGVGGDYGVPGPPYYAGTNVFNEGTTWRIRISAVSGTTLTPLKTLTGIPTVLSPGPGLDPDGDEWFTWTFTGGDTVALNPNALYAFEVASSAGYLGFDASPNTAYPGGQAFNSAGAARNFTNNTTGNLANHGFDRTFVLNFSAPPTAVPGDANANGIADVNDYTLIRNNLEKSVTAFTNGDLDGNSYVDLNDFRRWTNSVPPEVAASVNVPEPAATLLTAIGVAVGAAIRRRARRRSSMLPPANASEVGGRRKLSSLATRAALAIAAVALLSSAAGAGTLAMSAAAPAGNIMASQLVDIGPGTGDGGRNYLDNGGPPGQTFTVTVGGQANRFTFKGRGDSSDAWNGGQNPWEGTEIWGIQISSVDTGTGAMTVLATETATGFDAGGATAVADYLTFTLTTPVTLSVGPTYAFSIFLADTVPAPDGSNGADGGWFGLAHSDTDVYAGGSAINNNTSFANPGGNSGGPRRNFPVAGAGFAAPVPGSYDYVFAVQGGGVAPAPADFDENGTVNILDYNILKANFFLATGATHLLGDANGDGRVNLVDFTIWRNAVPASVAASVSIPEPATLIGGMAAAVALFGAARRSRRA